MKIAVMGAGGIGGYLGGRLAEAGEDVHLVARGAHLAALKAKGLTIESAHGNATLPQIHAASDPAEIGPVDLVLFTVKLGDAEGAAAKLPPLIGAGTKIVTLQNGIDSKDILGRHVDRDAPGVIINPGGIHRMVVDRMGGDAEMAGFFAACDRAVGIDAIPTDDPDNTVWGKFIALTAFAGATAIARLPIGAVYQHPETLDFMRVLLEELIAVARAEGQDFDQSHAERTIELFRNQPYEQKSSLLVDLEAGKSLELPWLSGRCVSLGRKHDIPTPANAAVVAALAAYVNGPPKLDRNLATGGRS